MAEVYFYHLTRTRLAQALPDLLEKVCAKNWRAVVRGTERSQLAELDEALWKYREDSFLAHGLAGAGHDANQPVLLTESEENANGAEILLLTGRAKITPAEVENYQRVCLMFNGGDEGELAAARKDWKALTDAGIRAQYWSQEGGSWKKLAQSKS